MMNMSKEQSHRGLIFGYIAIAVLTIAITGMSISVLAKPYTSAHDTFKAIVISVVDTTQSLVITDHAKDLFAESKQVDTLAINAAFLQKMREKGELLSSDEFASRITDYYNTLVAVLTALFVLFTLVTYITIKSKFEGKFEDKVRELEDRQRQKIVDELRTMLSDSKKIDEVIQTAIGGRIDDNIATKEEIDDLSTSIETNGKNLVILTMNVDDIKKKQQGLFKVVADLQDQIAEGAIVQKGTDTENEQGQEDIVTTE